MKVERGLFDQPSVYMIPGIAKASKANCSRYEDLLQSGKVCAGAGSQMNGTVYLRR